MRSKSIKAIIVNDLRRFWMVGFLGFLYMFFGTCSQILINYKDGIEIVEDILKVSNFTNIVTSTVLPIVAAVAVFRYLHNTASVTAEHSLPITRNELFTGHFISGYILCAVPIIINALIMALIAKPAMVQKMIGNRIVEVNVYTVSAVIKVTLIILLIMLVVYAVAVLAGMITGMTVMHVLASFGLLFLPTAIVLAINALASYFLLGYSSPMSINKLADDLVPMVALAEPSTIAVIAYLIAAALIAVLALVAYRHRNLECATEPLAFRFLAPIVVSILSFFMALAIGSYFDQNGIFLAGFIIGIIICYFPFVMMVDKSTKVFTKKNIKNGAVFFAIMIVMLAALIFDVFGYVNKVPATSDVASVDMGNVGLVNIVHDFDLTSDEPWNTEFTSEEAIDAITAFHKDCIDIACEDEYECEADLYDTACFSYKLKNGGSIIREYSVPKDLIMKNENMKKLYESRDFKDQYSISNSMMFKDKDVSKYLSATLMPAFEELGDETQIRDVRSLAEAVDKDFHNREFKDEFQYDYFSGMVGSIRFELSFNYPGDKFYEPILISVRSTDTNTIDWLKKHGYYDEIKLDEYDIIYVNVDKIKNETCEIVDSWQLETERTGVSTLKEFVDKYPFISSDNSEKYNYDLTLGLKNHKTGLEYEIFTSYSWNEAPGFVKNLK